MATLDELSRALIEADKAGNTEDAAILAKAYTDRKSASAPVGLQDTGQGRGTSFLSNVGRGAAGIVPNVIGGLGEVVGSDTLTETADSIEGSINEALPVNPLYQDEFIQKTGNVIGQGATTLASGGVGGLFGKAIGGMRGLNIGGQIGALAPATLGGVREGAARADQLGLTGGSRYARALLGGANELLSEKLGGVGTELGVLKKLAGESVEFGGKQIIIGAATEAGEEAGSQVLSNVEDIFMAPEGVRTPGVLEGVGESAALGAVGGTFMGSVNAAINTAAGNPTIPDQERVTIEGEDSTELSENISDLTQEQAAEIDRKNLIAEAANIAEISGSLPATAQLLNEIANEESTETTNTVPVTEAEGEVVEETITPTESIQEVVEGEITPESLAEETTIAQDNLEQADVIGDMEPGPVAELADGDVALDSEQTINPAQEIQEEQTVVEPVVEQTIQEQVEEESPVEQREIQPNDRVQFKREGAIRTGNYIGRDNLGRHVVEVNGKREFATSVDRSDPNDSTQIQLSTRGSNDNARSTRNDLQKLVDDFERDMPDAPKPTIVTAQEIAENPEFEYVRNKAKGYGITNYNRIDGWASNGRVYLVEGTPLKSARKKLIHEIIGHIGVDRVASPSEIKRIANIVRRVAPELEMDIRLKYPGIVLDELDLSREMLAFFSEQYQSADPANLPKGWKKAWQDIKRILRAIIKRLGGDPNAWDDVELHDFFRSAVLAANNSETDLDVGPTTQLSVSDAYEENKQNFPGTPEAIAENQRQLEAGVSNARETQARFAPFDQKNRMYIGVSRQEMEDDANAYLDTMPLTESFTQIINDTVPEAFKKSADGRQNIITALWLRRALTQLDSLTDPYEIADYHNMASSMADNYAANGTRQGRALGSRAQSGALLAPVAPILAHEKLMIDKGIRRIRSRFTEGADGATTRIRRFNKEAKEEVADELAGALEGDTPERTAIRKEASKLRNKAQESAERIFRSLVRPVQEGEFTKDPVRDLYEKHIANPMSEAEFASALADLGVTADMASTLARAAQDEIRGRELTRQLRQSDADARKIEVAERRASQIIYRTEEKLRQGSKDLSASASGDTINKAFREQVSEPMDWADFRDRLAALNVGEDVANRLFRTAEREASDQASMADFKGSERARKLRESIIGKDSKKLVDLLNTLRRKMYPEMNWKDIFEELPDNQRERQAEIYTRLRLDERLSGLTQDEAVQLTNELDKAWQRERRKVFQRELGRVGALGEKTKRDTEKVVKAIPALLRSMNLGTFGSEMFREAVAAEYGIRKLSAEESARMRKLAIEAWDLPSGIIRNKKLRDLLGDLQRTTGSSRVEILNNFWMASVLSGSATSFDTFMSALNGFGNNLLQASTLLARRNPAAAVGAHAQWWKGLNQGLKESMSILLKGDYSVLKRFGEDMNKTLEGESNFRPIPLGEDLIRNGTWFQKGLAVWMNYVTRIMSSADHINNTATTHGAMAVARALNPELYNNLHAFTAEERAKAKEQALLDVTGGAKPKDLTERNAVSVRTRELLHGLLSEDHQQEASFIGDQAAYQNDPIGIFGKFYEAVNSTLGKAERSAAEASEDPDFSNPVTRAALAVIAGGLRGMTGTKFMRFGFNFGNDLTQYIPGTVLAQKLAPVYGSELSQSQKDLLMAKNVFGFFLASSLIAYFMQGLDDDDKPMIEGNWSNLSKEKKAQLRSAGREPMTITWKTADGTVKRVSYKSWPTGGIFVAVGGALDQKRYDPAKWEQTGVGGHLLKGVTTGVLHVRDTAALEGLSELIGSSSYSSNADADFVDKLTKLPARFIGGFVPNLLKDVDTWDDPRHFRPETTWDEYARNVPVARRSVADGRPMLDLLGGEVKVSRTPWRRVFSEAEKPGAYNDLGDLLDRGMTLTPPNPKRKIRFKGQETTIEALGKDAEWKYAKILGGEYKRFLEQEGNRIKLMTDSRAEDFIRDRSRILSDRAEKILIRELRTQTP